MSSFSDEVSEYLAGFRRKYSAETVTGFLKQAGRLSALVGGEAIIDEYQYCETLGKSGKEPILAAQFIRGEKFAGGSVAVANHVASFAGATCLLTMLGSIDSHEDFIREKLAPGVEPEFLTMQGSPT